MPNGKSKDSTATGNDVSAAHTIGSINNLPLAEKRTAFSRLIPAALVDRFELAPDFHDAEGHDLLHLNCQPGSSIAEMSLYHQVDFPDPVLYGQIEDTITNRIHVLLYVLNDPESPRFDVDRLPDDTSTGFGTQCRNLAAEEAAMRFGLAPGQIRQGLHMFGAAVQAFEDFVASLGHDMYFAEPLHYHNAIIFERHGFAYERGRRLMERIQRGFAEDGDLHAQLDGSTPFRMPEAAHSIRLRSWALHDNLLGEPFTGVTMYKFIGKSAQLNTGQGCAW